jgi:hypothetical protein
MNKEEERIAFWRGGGFRGVGFGGEFLLPSAAVSFEG